MVLDCYMFSEGIPFYEKCIYIILSSVDWAVNTKLRRLTWPLFKNLDHTIECLNGTWQDYSKPVQIGSSVYLSYIT